MPRYASLSPVFTKAPVERKFSREHERAGESYEAILWEVSWSTLTYIEAPDAETAIAKLRRPWNRHPIVEEARHAPKH